MKKNLGIMLFSIAFFSCSKNVYVKNDYPFYQENFQLPPDSNLRTDGVYVLESIWSENAEKKPKEHLFYKFYKTGQSNLTVDLNHEINTEKEYIESIKNHVESTKATDFKTHFESYYSMEGNRLVIQRVTVPRNVFTYNYGLIENGKLILVKETIDGKGKLDDKYFTDYYKATYRFLPLDKAQIENLKPGW